MIKYLIRKFYHQLILNKILIIKDKCYIIYYIIINILTVKIIK